MAWVPPSGVTPVDRRNPNTAFEADLPAMLDWLTSKYPGNHVVGLFVTARDTGRTFRVDGRNSDGTYRLTRFVSAEEFASLRDLFDLADLRALIASASDGEGVALRVRGGRLVGEIGEVGSGGGSFTVLPDGSVVLTGVRFETSPEDGSITLLGLAHHTSVDGAVALEVP